MKQVSVLTFIFRSNQEEMRLEAWKRGRWKISFPCHPQSSRTGEVSTVFLSHSLSIRLISIWSEKWELSSWVSLCSTKPTCSIRSPPIGDFKAGGLCPPYKESSNPYVFSVKFVRDTSPAAYGKRCILTPCVFRRRR